MNSSGLRTGTAAWRTGMDLAPPRSMSTQAMSASASGSSLLKSFETPPAFLASFSRAQAYPAS